MTPIFIVAIIFGSIVAVVLGPFYLRSQERQRLQETLRTAIDKGQPLPAEIVEALTTDVKVRPRPSAARDLRVGIIWIGVAVGFAALGLAISANEPEALYPMLGVAAFPGFIGMAFVLISFLAREKDS